MPRLLRLTLALFVALCGVVAAAREVGYALPDGGQLAINFAGDLRLIDARSYVELDLSTRLPNEIIDSLQWSPDGTRFAFLISGSIDIGIIELPTLQFRYLTNTLTDNEWISTFTWSPDSREIAYTRQLRYSYTSATEIYRKTVDGQELHLFSSERMIDDLVWSPDSTLLASRFVMTSGVRYHLIALDGSGGHEVSADAVPDWLRLDLADGYYAPSPISWRPPRPR
jgi:WD40 repeat protein